MFGIGRNANATFKPAKKAPAGSRRFELHKHAEATLGAGNLCQAVKCPTGENLNDWQAHAAASASASSLSLNPSQRSASASSSLGLSLSLSLTSLSLSLSLHDTSPSLLKPLPGSPST